MIRLNGCALATLLLVMGCSNWQAPAPWTPAFEARATYAEEGGVRVGVHVLSGEESTRLLGVDVRDRGIEPLWIQVSNRTAQPVRILQAGIDPDYFSPLEVSWMYHALFRGDRNKRLDEHFHAPRFHAGPSTRVPRPRAWCSRTRR